MWDSGARMAQFDLRGKAALVTGGARGIGFATARALLARGASVAIVDLKAEEAERATSQLDPDRTLAIGADVTDRGAMQRAVASTCERFGGLDVVVANAGIASTVATVRATPSESFERVLDVNLMGVYRTVDAALPEILRRQGHMVLISSVYAFVNGSGEVAYAMAKAGVEQLGRALRIELAPHGAGASVAYFGFIDTEMVRRALDQDPLADRLFENLPRPLRKRLQPSAAGEAIAQGIERRQARIIRPRRWAIISTLRGILGPLNDAQLVRDEKVQALVRELDARAGEQQTTTA
jgi:NAD(P)-dependent dehydrogenase (short-subunit alcohol dehydrogenase family)